MFDEEKDLTNVSPEQTGQTETDTGAELEAQAEPETSEAKLQRAFDAALRKSRKERDRELKQIFGTTDLREIADYYKVGQTVTSASGRAPGDVINYVQQRTVGLGVGPQGASSGNVGQSDVGQRLSRIEGLLSDQQAETIRQTEVAAARKEFGTLFDESYADIEELAEDKGLSLVDAAAVVLRPKLRDHITQQEKVKREAVRQRQVVPTGDKAGGNIDLSAKLSPKQKEIASKMGLSPREYAEQLRALGKLQ